MIICDTYSIIICDVYTVSEPGRVYDVPGLRRIQAAAVSDVQRQQEVGAQKSLHHRDDRPEVYELRRSGIGAMLCLLNRIRLDRLRRSDD